MNIERQTKGFTLLELLIVIAILAILAMALVLMLNPIESIRKSRDAQRISDLSSLKTALGLYMTSVSSPDLDGSVASGCLDEVGGVPNTVAQIFYSAEVVDVPCLASVSVGADAVAGSAFNAVNFCRYPGNSGDASKTDGTGWIPVNFSLTSGGSSISNLPLDPTNVVAAASAPTSNDLVYRYACQHTTAGGEPSYVFEINTVLESDTYKAGSADDKSAKDGGDNPNYYEVGTNLRLIGTGINF